MQKTQILLFYFNLISTLGKIINKTFKQSSILGLIKDDTIN